MTLDDLIAYGANVDEGMGRCMNNETFYLRLVDTAKKDAGFETLPQAIAEGRLGDAFDIAHGLKGALGNLALTPLYDPMVEITEHLRSKTEMDYQPLLDQIAQAHARLCEL